MFGKRLISLIVLAGLMLASTVSGAELPDPKTGAPDGNPMSLLLIESGGHGIIDPQLKKELDQKGYKLRILKSFGAYKFDVDYLKNFSAVLLSGYPGSKDTFGVGSWRTAQTLEPNTRTLHDYVQNGGSIFLIPDYGGGGRSKLRACNKFLKPYVARYLPQQLMPDPDFKDTWTEARIHPGHPITKNLANLAYPADVLRWDTACSANPILVGDGWTVLASAAEGHGTYVVKSNNGVFPERQTEHRNLWVVRKSGKGTVALSGINAFYILSHAYHKKNSVGEAGTGKIDGVFMHGKENGPASEGFKFLDRTLRYLGSQSAKNGIGGKDPGEPTKLPLPETQRVMDWDKREIPPTWASKVVPDRRTWVFDPYPDPTIDKIDYYKALVGPRTEYSVGEGSVKDWRKAAMDAGYDAIMFADLMEHTTREEFQQLVEDCEKNSDENFVCLPGLDAADSQDTRYLLLGLDQYPLPQWTTHFGRRILHTPNLSLGLGGRKMVSLHHPTRSGMQPQMFKHYQGITVYTYDEKGNLIDDGLFEYQWQISSDSNPIPIAAHELTSPSQVAKAARSGFQQILPAPSITRGVEYFRHPHALYFTCPVRYFISEGPILDGWSILNKDIKGPELNRDRYRMAVGVSSDANIKDITLYDGFRLARRWRPESNDFDTLVVGEHDAQHMYMLVAEDEKGRRVVSPQIRTVVRNYRLRCGDRQNWLGSQPNWCIYPGWRRTYGHWRLPLRNARESTGYWDKEAVFFEFPFYSNHFVMTDLNASKKFVSVFGGPHMTAGDSSPMFNVQDKDFTETYVRTLYRNPPKRKDFNVLMVETTIRVKRDLEPVINGPIYPAIRVRNEGRRLILPGKEPTTLPAEKLTKLPVGSYLGGWIPLTEGLVMKGKRVGYPAPDNMDVVPRGTEWTARYLLLSGKRWWWRAGGKGKIDPRAEQALNQMGFRGDPPYSFDLKQGKLENIGYWVDFQAADGGIRGGLKNSEGEKILYDLPCRIHGLNRRHPAALWRSDAKYVEWFGVHEGIGYVPLNGDRNVDFYAGNIVQTDPRLFVAVLTWTADRAEFRVNNPTTNAITTTFATVQEITGHKQIKKQITVPGGRSVTVK
ncbi:MAG: hypothetical protein ACLFWL_14015 [Candidatus Brocadiia bacterium]